jgi:hypothetical protein
MGYIDFTDETGNTQVTNGLTLPGRRFTSWTPDTIRIADRRTALGSGITYEYLYRQDYAASFQIEHIPVTALPTVIRWKNWAMKGCEFWVYTEDTQSRFYLCRLRQDTTPTIEMSDREALEYTLSLEVVSAVSPPELLECTYRE